LLDVYDGVQPAYPDFHPKAAAAPDGKLWFVNSTAVQMLDAKHLLHNPVIPNVVIQSLNGDGRFYDPHLPVELPPLTRDIQIDFTALSFVVPQRVRFRYKLDGWDNEWQDPGARRQSFYTNLPPGAYRFRVVASNDDGVWNSVGDSVRFRIRPAFYQTRWFYALCALACLALLAGLYRVRVRQVAAEVRGRLEARLGERERIARDLHDTLLQSLHGLMFQFQAAHNMLARKQEEGMPALERAIRGTETAIADSRDAIQNLRPHELPQADLAQLLQKAGEELAVLRPTGQESPTFRVIVEGETRKLSAEAHQEVYRIARELIRNAFNHAAAQRIEVEISYDKSQLRLRVRDDGKGIDPKVLAENKRPGHWGLPGVRERAQRIGARLEFWSQSGAGTEVELIVPAATAYNNARSWTPFRLFG